MAITLEDQTNLCEEEERKARLQRALEERIKALQEDKRQYILNTGRARTKVGLAPPALA